DGGATAFTLDMLSDLDGDRLDDPVVSWRAGKALHSAVLNYNLFPLKRFTAEGALRTGTAGETGTSGMTAMRVADLDGDGKRELLVWVTASHFYRQDQAKPEVGNILRLDAAGATVADYDAGARLISCVLADLDGDGAGEIIATDRLGFIHVLNRDLMLRARTIVTTNRYDSVELQIAAVADLDGDGHP